MCIHIKCAFIYESFFQLYIEKRIQIYKERRRERDARSSDCFVDRSQPSPFTQRRSPESKLSLRHLSERHSVTESHGLLFWDLGVSYSVCWSVGLALCVLMLEVLIALLTEVSPVPSLSPVPTSQPLNQPTIQPFMLQPLLTIFTKSLRTLGRLCSPGGGTPCIFHFGDWSPFAWERVDQRFNQQSIPTNDPSQL